MSYGGDFGDKPNLKAFCMNGVIFADRSLNPKYYEVKTVYSPVHFALKSYDPASGNVEIEVINRNHHIGLSGYNCAWTPVLNGVEGKACPVSLPALAPGKRGVMTLNLRKLKPGDADLRLNLSVTLQ